MMKMIWGCKTIEIFDILGPCVLHYSVHWSDCSIRVTGVSGVSNFYELVDLCFPESFGFLDILLILSPISPHPLKPNTGVLWKTKT